jgi:uncharacterized membrane protein YiaA
MTSFATFLIGFFTVVVGLAIAAFLVHVPGQWIGVGTLVLVGFGILLATQRTGRGPR